MMDKIHAETQCLKDAVVPWLMEGKSCLDMLIYWLQGNGFKFCADDRGERLAACLPRKSEWQLYDMKNIFSTRVSELIDQKPEINKIGDSPEEYLHNLLTLAACLNMPEILAEPLCRMLRRWSLEGRWREYDLVADLRTALMINQIDRRLEVAWRDMMRGQRHFFLGGDFWDGCEGLRWLLEKLNDQEGLVSLSMQIKKIRGFGKHNEKNNKAAFETPL
jgi:hypothetical protein